VTAEYLLFSFANYIALTFDVEKITGKWGMTEKCRPKDRRRDTGVLR
jgi:hypothetical protein